MLCYLCNVSCILIGWRYELRRKRFCLSNIVYYFADQRAISFFWQGLVALTTVILKAFLNRINPTHYLAMTTLFSFQNIVWCLKWKANAFFRKWWISGTMTQYGGAHAHTSVLDASSNQNVWNKDVVKVTKQFLVLVVLIRCRTQ